MTSGRVKMTSAECFEVVADCISAGFDQKERLRIFGKTKHISYESGETIFHQNGPAFSCHFLCQGKIKLTNRTRSGKVMLFKFCEPGNFLAFPTTDVHAVTATAVTPSLVCFIPKVGFLELLHEYPRIAVAAIQSLSKDVTSLRKRLVETAYNGADERVIGALADIVQKQEFGEDASTRAVLDLSQKTLAEIVGLSRQSLNQCIARLARAEILTVGRRKITIADPRRLRKLAARSAFSRHE